MPAQSETFSSPPQASRIRHSEANSTKLAGVAQTPSRQRSAARRIVRSGRRAARKRSLFAPTGPELRTPFDESRTRRSAGPRPDAKECQLIRTIHRKMRSGTWVDPAIESALSGIRACGEIAGSRRRSQIVSGPPRTARCFQRLAEARKDIPDHIRNQDPSAHSSVLESRCLRRQLSVRNYVPKR